MCFEEQVMKDVKKATLFWDRMARVNKTKTIMGRQYDGYTTHAHQALRKFNLPEPPMIARPAIPGRDVWIDGKCTLVAYDGVMVREEKGTDEDKLAIRLIEYTEASIGRIRREIIFGDKNDIMIGDEFTPQMEEVFCPACKFATEVRRIQNSITREVGSHVKEECCCMFPKLDPAPGGVGAAPAEILVRHVHTLGNRCPLHELVWVYFLEMAMTMAGNECVFLREAGWERTTMVEQILTRASWKLNEGPPANWPREEAPEAKRTRTSSAERDSNIDLTGDHIAFNSE